MGNENSLKQRLWLKQNKTKVKLSFFSVANLKFYKLKLNVDKITKNSYA